MWYIITFAVGAVFGVALGIFIGLILAVSFAYAASTGERTEKQDEGM